MRSLWLGLAVFWWAGVAAADDWPQFRGPDGSGRAESAELILPWPEDGPERLWEVPLGGGYSGVSAVGNSLYTLASEGPDEFLLALDAETGKEKWRLRTDAKRRDQFGDGPRSTPTVDGDRVFAISALAHLWAVDRHTGEALWDRDLRKEFGATVPTWGVAASPIVVGDLLLFNVGGRPDRSLVAFHKKTGKVRWSGGTDIPGYSLPLHLELAGVEQSIFFTGNQLLAVDPQTGRALWRKGWKTAYDVNAATPVFVPPDRLFVSSGYDTGASLLRVVPGVDGLALEEVWHSGKMRNQFSSSVYHDGHLYGFDNDYFKCIDVETGEDRWRKTGFGHGSLIYADGHLVVLSDSGRLALVEADPDIYREKASAKISRGKHWTAPTLHRGRLLVRNQRQLTAFRLAAPRPPVPPKLPSPPKPPAPPETSPPETSSPTRSDAK